MSPLAAGAVEVLMEAPAVSDRMQKCRKRAYAFSPEGNGR